MISKWEPVHCFVEDAGLRATIAAAPCLLVLAVSCLPLCLQWWWEAEQGEACKQLARSLLAIGQSFALLVGQAAH